MNEENLEAKLIRIHEYGKVLSSLYSTSLLSLRFGKISHMQANEWLKGNIPRRWTMAAVFPVMSQWMDRFCSNTKRQRTKKATKQKFSNKRGEIENFTIPD